ncbi:hypothetical protein AAFF_G00239870 [Aldrovandia affinis]|uniref:Uncharacterized protein n=1 Tax=Aldrovandia affinis TaxID=143900 RepID=A0AAD7SW88_9TELE|nr:hypothetical protein AAFF_G00239870 [Aldrovandia affinis]
MPDKVLSCAPLSRSRLLRPQRVNKVTVLWRTARAPSLAHEGQCGQSLGHLRRPRWSGLWEGPQACLLQSSPSRLAPSRRAEAE